MQLIKKLLLKIIETKGYKLIKLEDNFNKLPVELSDKDRLILDYINKNELTMTPTSRLIATLQLCKYVVENDIPGHFVECGVWRGGHAILAKKIFEALGSNKEVYMYDTFLGMSKPDEVDVSYINEKKAIIDYEISEREEHNNWCYASLEDVKNNCKEAGLDMSGIHFIKGDVCETLDEIDLLPNKICIMRLDTDWYKSTLKELEVLYPLLSNKGALIIDDYGHWLGSKKAVDQYFTKKEISPLFHIIDYSSRLCLKIE